MDSILLWSAAMETIDEQRMQKMAIALSDSNVEDVTQFTIFPSAENHFYDYVFNNFIARVLGFLSLLLLIYALFFVKISTLSPNEDYVRENAHSQRPERLHNLLHEVADRARREGIMSSISISQPNFIADNGIEVQKL